VKGIGAGCDEEAVRVLKEVPPWNPAKQRARYVRQRMVLPIIFKIQSR
jgi:protein TonB